MNLKIRRRRFGQLALASVATAAIANFTGKAAAQSQEVLYSVSLSKRNANTIPQLTLKSSNLRTGQEISSSKILTNTSHNVPTSVTIATKSTSAQPQEWVTGLDSLSDGTLVKTSVSRSNNGYVNHLIFTDPKSSQTIKTLKVWGFSNNNSTVDSLLATKENNLIGIISLNQGAPPFDLAIIDRTTGKVISSTASGLPALEGNKRYSNLAQAPDGTIYATTLSRRSATTLVRMNLNNKSIHKVVQLSYNGEPLRKDLLSLTVSSSGQLHALANLDHQATNSLFTVDVKTGVLTRVRQLDAQEITFIHA